MISSIPVSAYPLFDGTFRPTDMPHGGYGDSGSSAGFGTVWNGWYCLPQPDSIQIVPAPGRSGYAAKFTSRPGYLYNCGGNQHNVISTNRPALPRTARDVWYGWSMMLDPTWTPSGTWGRVGFGSHSKFYTEPNTGINFQFGAADTSVVLMVRNTWTRILGSHSKGVWHDWMFHVKWATDNTGFLEVYHKVDGEQEYTRIYSRYGFQTQEVINVPEDLFEARVGIYRGQVATSTQIFYVLDPKIGTEKKDVSYGSAGINPNPAPPVIPQPVVTPDPVTPVTPDIITSIGLALANYSSSSTVKNSGPYRPDKDWHQTGSIRAWIDIVGFGNITHYNNTDFIPGNASDSAIVLYDVNPKLEGYIDNIDKTVTLSESKSGSESENILTATLKVVMDWHVVICDDDSCWNVYFSEKASFKDSEKTPQKLNIPIEAPEASITFYNNSYNPKTVISLKKSPWTVSERYAYQGQSIEHISKIGDLKTTSKGVHYIELYPADIWKNYNESRFSRLNDTAVINGAGFNISELVITSVYPYDTEVSDWNQSYNEIEYSPYKTFQPMFFFILFLSIIPVLTINGIIKRLNI